MSIGVDFRDDGVLWAINRVVFHPRGFALGLNSDGTMVLLGKGDECWAFDTNSDDQCFAAFEALLERARRETS